MQISSSVRYRCGFRAARSGTDWGITPGTQVCLGYEMGSGAFCEQSASSPFHAKLMVRDTLPVPVSGSSVEPMFSATGRIATWQRSRLRDSTIMDIMMYKAALNLMDFMESELEEDPEWDDLPVPKRVGKIPAEWEQDWWKKKLRLELRPEIESRFREDSE